MNRKVKQLMLLTLLASATIATVCAIPVLETKIAGMGFVTYTGNAEILGVDIVSATAFNVIINFKVSATYSVTVEVDGWTDFRQGVYFGTETFTFTNVEFPETTPFTIKIKVAEA